MKSRERLIAACGVAFAVVLVSSVTKADLIQVPTSGGSNGTFTQPGNVDMVVEGIRNAASGWMKSLLGVAGVLYAALFTIEWCVRSGFAALRGGDFGQLLVTFFQLVLRRGAWGFVIGSGSYVLPAIVRSLHEAGIRAGSAAGAGVAGAVLGSVGGKAPAITPQALVDGVLEFASVQVDKLSLFNPDVLGMMTSVAAATVAVVFSYGLCAIFTWIVIIRGYLTLGGGCILLGFGGSSVTERYAWSYVSALIGTGLNLMALELVKSLIFPFLHQWVEYAKADPGFGLSMGLSMSLSALAMAVTIISIPGVVNSWVSGGTSHTAEGVALATMSKGGQAASAAAGSALSAAPAAAGASLLGGGGIGGGLLGGLSGSGSPPSGGGGPPPSGGSGGVVGPSSAGGSSSSGGRWRAPDPKSADRSAQVGSADGGGSGDGGGMRTPAGAGRPSTPGTSPERSPSPLRPNGPRGGSSSNGADGRRS